MRFWRGRKINMVVNLGGGEYKRFYQPKSVRVTLILKDIYVGASSDQNGNSGNLQLEGKVIGETENNIEFEEIRSTNALEVDDTFNGVTEAFDGKYTMIQKSLIAVISAKKRGSSKEEDEDA
jgi:hypothetical protein